MELGQAIGEMSPARQAAELDWHVVRTLRGGTRAMREAGTTYLPKDKREERNSAEYTKRLARSVLYPAYDLAVCQIAAKPFQRAVKVTETGNPMLDLLATNCDRQGKSLTRFAQQLLDAAVDRGVVHFLVDLPDATANSLAEETARDIRPYFAMVHPDAVYAWGMEDDGTGIQELAWVTIHETYTVGTIGDQKVAERIRYYDRSTWEVWERLQPAGTKTYGVQSGGSDYRMIRAGINRLGVVPLVTVYTAEVEPMVGKPPMLELAWQNVAHWQSLSQQAHILHYVRAPMLQGKGCSHEQIEDGVTLGAGAVMLSGDPNFGLSYVEVTGDSVAAGERDLVEIEKRMVALGSQPMELTTGPAQTATETSADESRSQTLAQSWAESLEWGIYRGYELAAMWIGAELDEDFTLSVFREFGLIQRTQLDATVLQGLMTANKLTTETGLRELARRGFFADDFDPEVEAEELEAEAPLPAMFGQPQQDADEEPAAEDVEDPEDAPAEAEAAAEAAAEA